MIRADALAAALLTCSAHAANPAQDYVLNCMGCHGARAEGIPGKIPPLANALSRFMRSPEGRNYVLRVPGAANSALSDEQLAAVLNWLAVTFDTVPDRSTRAAMPSAPAIQPAAFTTSEVAAVRRQPLLSVLATRSAVVRNLATTGPSPPVQY